MSSMQIDLQLDTSSFVTIYYHINTGLTRNTNDDDNARNREVFTEHSYITMVNNSTVQLHGP